MSQFNNFKHIQTYLDLNENDIIELGTIFDELHGKIISGDVRNFNRGEYSKYYSNRDNTINFKQQTSIILYWNLKPVFYFHRTNELIYIPKTIAKRILDKFDTIQHENTPYISQANLIHIYGWASKYLEDNWGTLEIVQ